MKQEIFSLVDAVKHVQKPLILRDSLRPSQGHCGPTHSSSSSGYQVETSVLRIVAIALELPTMSRDGSRIREGGNTEAVAKIRKLMIFMTYLINVRPDI